MTGLVITGVTGLCNRGVEALVSPLVEYVRGQMPNLDITILTNNPAYDAVRMQRSGVQFLLNSFYLPGGIRTRVKQKAMSILGRDIEPQTEAADAIRAAAVVVASGGDVFSSDYGNLMFHLVPLELAQRHGLPVVFLAHSIGPFQSAREAEAWVRVAQCASIITTRESITYQYVTEELGISPDRVYLTADLAFLLSPPLEETTASLLAFYGVETDRPTVALAVSRGISRFAAVHPVDHLAAWQRVVEMLIDEMHAQVLLVPHVQDASATNDDRLVATRLLERLSYDPRVRLVGGEHSASEFKGLIAACDMVVAERMHAALAGLSSGVCTVAVGYSVKAEGIMKDVLGSDLLQKGFLIPVDEFVKSGGACEKLKFAWQERKEVKGRLAKVLPQIKARARLNFDLLEKVLVGRGLKQ